MREIVRRFVKARRFGEKGEKLRTDQYWGAKSAYAPNWYSFCATYINESITGSPTASPSLWAFTTFVSDLPVDSMLEIGCHNGKKLISFVEAKLARCGYGIDIAAKAIESARISAREHGVEEYVNFYVMDLNEPTLSRNAYDAILSNGVLHHIHNIRQCVGSLYAALRPGGKLFASEFIGPRRYNYSKDDVALVNRGIAILPPELRGDTPFTPDILQPKLDADPSEAVSTGEIKQVLAATFDEVYVRPYGGNVLMRALSPLFFERFDPHNATHRNAVTELIAFEREALCSGVPSHHAYFVASKSACLPV